MYRHKIATTLVGIFAVGLGSLMPIRPVLALASAPSYLLPTKYEKSRCLQSTATNKCFCSTNEAYTESCELTYVTLPTPGWACIDTGGTSCDPQ